ncbi:MAG: PAS domain S-box protein [Candidatus Hydrogenedentes bacterium]|nr:PAS domain S-box protein [Candidatus Hydrogenedentota bacterium]
MRDSLRAAAARFQRAAARIPAGAIEPPETASRRLEFDAIEQEICARFSIHGPAAFQEHIDASMEKLGACLGMDIVALYQHNPENGRFERLACWHGPGRQGLAELSKVFHPGENSWWISTLSAGRAIHLGRLDEAPEPAKDLGRFLRDAGIQNLVVVPLRLQNELSGLLGMATARGAPPLDPEVLSMLQAQSALFASAIERARVEEALRLSEARFRSLIEQSTDAVWCMEYDEPVDVSLPVEEQVRLIGQCRIVECNAAFSRGYGIEDPEVLIGRPLLDFATPEMVNLEPLTRIFVDRGYHASQVAYSLKGVSGEYRHYEYSAHGHVAYGRLTRVWGISRDVTMERFAEETLRTSEQNLRNLLAAIPDLILVMDRKGVCLQLFTGDPSILYAPAEEVIGRPVFELLPPDIAPRVLGMLEATLERGESVHLDYSLRFDERERWFSARSARFTFNGEACVLFLAREVTRQREAEAKLEESEVRLRAILDNAKNAIFLKGIDGRYILVNKYFAAMNGLDAGAVAGKTGYELFDPCAARVFEESDEKVLRTGLSTSEEVTVETAIHKRRILTIKFPVRRGDDEIIGIGGVATDITELKNAEEALRESEKRFELAVNGSNDGFWDWPNIAEDFFWCSTRFYELLGYAQGEVAPCAAFFTGIQHPDDVGFVRQALTNHMSRRMRLDFEHRLKTKDGAFRWFRTRGQAVWNDAGRAVRMSGSLQDIDERKQAQHALQQSKDRFVAIFQNVNDAIFIHGVDTAQIIEANEKACERFGYTRLELLKLGIDEITHGDDAAARDEIRQMLQDAAVQPQLLEWRMRSRSGDLWWSEVSLNPARIAGRACIVAVVRDITERKQAEEQRRMLEAQMQQAQRMESLGVLAGGIAHDFNNLLVGVMGNADLALLEMDPAARERRYLNAIVKSAERAAELCNQLLAYSGKGRFVVSPVNLSDLVEDMIHLLEVSISKSAHLDCSFAIGIPAIEADLAQVRQVIMNLITNASDALNDEVGVISVSTGTQFMTEEGLSGLHGGGEPSAGNYVYLQVRDSGCGMSAEQINRIFEPFYTSKSTGRGLGLSAVLGIIRGHRGACRVKSEPGMGTTITVYFPASHLSPVSLIVHEPQRSNTPGKGRVLVIDDEPHVRDLAAEILQQSGFEVLTAYDGQRGITIFERHAAEIDVVLLDMTMPRMNGEECFRALSAINPAVKVLLSSGYSEQEAMSRFLGEGLAGFIQKPYRAGDLIHAIGVIVEAAAHEKGP